MKNFYLVPTISFLICLVCFVSFNIIGSYVDAGGILREPFGLIPIGFLFLLIAIISGIIWLIKYQHDKIR